MKKKNSRRMLEYSCQWIKQHWNAQNLDVPDELLCQWIYESDEDQIEPTGFHLAVFSFGYFHHEIISSGTPVGVARKIPTTEILERFQAWQMKLGLAEMHRHTDLRVRPLPLFTFSKDEQVEVWRTTTETRESA